MAITMRARTRGLAVASQYGQTWKPGDKKPILTSPKHRPQKVLARLSAFWGQVKIDFNSAGSLGDSFLSYPLSLSNGFPNMSIICIGELMWISEVKSQLGQLFHPARRARRKRGNGGPKSLCLCLCSALLVPRIPSHIYRRIQLRCSAFRIASIEFVAFRFPFLLTLLIFQISSFLSFHFTVLIPETFHSHAYTLKLSRFPSILCFSFLILSKGTFPYLG